MPDTAKDIRNAILIALGASFLTGCSGKSEPATDDTEDTSSNLSAIPAGEYPDCSEDPEPCCVDVYCHEPADGNCIEITAENGWDAASTITGLSLGSGNCLCSEPDGPYSNEGAEAYTDTVGSCCYLVGIVGCEGRPMQVAGQLRTAPLVRGRRWGSA